jgi:hypothetical protein
MSATELMSHLSGIVAAALVCAQRYAAQKKLSRACGCVAETTRSPRRASARSLAISRCNLALKMSSLVDGDGGFEVHTDYHGASYMLCPSRVGLRAL